MRFFEFNESTDTKDVALDFIKQVTLSSKLGNDPSALVIAYLRQSVKTGDYLVYRGISIGSLTPDQRRYFRANPINVGDEIPEMFRIPNQGQTVIHTTTKISVAKQYARGGELSLVYELVIPNDQVLFDSAYVSKCFKEADFDHNTWSYFKIEKEVLVQQGSQFSTKVIAVKFA